MRFLIISFFILIFNTSLFSQGCCSGGAGSPIAGGAATGVLQENQMEISLNYQFNQSNKFFNEHKDERRGGARQMLTAQDPYIGVAEGGRIGFGIGGMGRRAFLKMMCISISILFLK